MTATTAEQAMDELARVAWRQWTAIGVTGRTEPATAPVDPEALIILTARLGDHDARLRDAAIDWCVAAGYLVNGSRLTHIMSTAGLVSDPAIAQFLATVAAAGGPVWGGRDVAPAPYSARGKVLLTSLTGDARLLLRLRASVGVNARADILLRLLTAHEAILIPNLVAATHFTRTNVDKTLAVLELAGHVEVILSGERGRRVRLSDDSPFRAWGHLQARVYDWPSLFDMVFRSVALVGMADEQADVVFGIEARSFIEEWRSVLAGAHIPAPPTLLTGALFVAAARSWSVDLPAELDRLSR
jgi:hypothetical protein